MLFLTTFKDLYLVVQRIVVFKNCMLKINVFISQGYFLEVLIIFTEKECLHLIVNWFSLSDRKTFWFWFFISLHTQKT